MPIGFRGFKPPGFLAENVDVCFGVFAIVAGLGFILAIKQSTAVLIGIGFLIVGIVLLIKEREFLKEVINRTERRKILLTIGLCLAGVGLLSSVAFESGSLGQKIGFLVMIIGVVVILSSEILGRRK